MKFNVNQQDLQQALNYCQGVIEKRSTLPILSNVLLDASKTKLTITATDLDLIFVHQINDVEILEEGKMYGADILLQRSAELASDDAGKIDAIIDCVTYAESKLNKNFDYVIDLDVTSPLRNVIDIENCLEFTKNEVFKNLITVTNSKKNPYFNQIEITNEGPQLVKSGHNIKGRQSAPRVYDMNASIYVWSKDFLINELDLLDILLKALSVL